MSLGRQIARLRRDDIPELSAFLINGFGVPASSSFFSPGVLAWKYFDGPDGSSDESTGSLIARSAGRIIGHIGMCFRQLIISGDSATPVPTMHAIDWLGSPAHPGSGAILMLEAFANSKTQIAVGGSAQSQALFPRLGFEQKAKVERFRRVLSPSLRFRTTGQGFVRKCAGTAKDVASILRAPSVRGLPTVELRPVSSFTEEIDGLLRRSSLRSITCQPDHQLLNSYLRYPLSGFSGWTIHASGRMIGFAVLNITQQGRTRPGKIVDCRLDTEEPRLWQAVVASLVSRIRALGADDVSCFATHPGLHAALVWNGFSKWSESNVCIRDKQQLLPRDLPFGLSEYDADGAIL